MSGAGLSWAAAAAATAGPPAAAATPAAAPALPRPDAAATSAEGHGKAVGPAGADAPPRADGSTSAAAAHPPGTAPPRASFSLSSLPAALQQVQAMIKRGGLLGSSLGSGASSSDGTTFAPLTSSTTVVKPHGETGPYVPGAPAVSYTSPLEEDLPVEVRQCIAWLQAGGSRWDGLVRTLAMENAVLKNAADRESSEATRLRLELRDTSIRAQALEHTASLQEREIRRLAGIVLQLTSSEQLELGAGAAEEEEALEDGAEVLQRTLLMLQQPAATSGGEEGEDEDAGGEDEEGSSGEGSSQQAPRSTATAVAGTGAAAVAAASASAAAVAAAAVAAASGVLAGTATTAVTDPWWFADQPDTTLLATDPSRVPPAGWITGAATTSPPPPPPSATSAGAAAVATSPGRSPGGTSARAAVAASSSRSAFSEPEAAALVAAVAADESDKDARPGHGSATAPTGIGMGAQLKLSALAAFTGGALSSTVSAVPSKLRAALVSALGGAAAPAAPAEAEAPPRPVVTINTAAPAVEQVSAATEATSLPPPLSARSSEEEGALGATSPEDGGGGQEEAGDSAPATARSGATSPEPNDDAPVVSALAFKDWAVETVDGVTATSGAEAPLSPSKLKRRREELSSAALRDSMQQAFNKVLSPRGWRKGGEGSEAASATGGGGGSAPPTPTSATPAVSFTSSARKSLASTLEKGKALTRPLAKAKAGPAAAGTAGASVPPSVATAAAAAPGAGPSGLLPGFAYSSRPPGLRRRLARLVSQIEVLLPSRRAAAAPHPSPNAWNSDFLRAKLRELLADLDEMAARHAYAAAARVEGGPATPLPWLAEGSAAAPHGASPASISAATAAPGLWTAVPPGVAPGTRSGAAAMAASDAAAAAASPVPASPSAAPAAGSALPLPAPVSRAASLTAPSPSLGPVEASVVLPPGSPLDAPIQVLAPEVTAGWYAGAGAGGSGRGRRGGGGSDFPRPGSDASASASGSGTDGEVVDVAAPPAAVAPSSPSSLAAPVPGGLYPLRCQTAGAVAPLKYPSTPLPPGVKGRGLRILSLDGGGIRGLLGLEVLRRLERETGRPAYELFDLMAGTSTGGFLAMNLAYRRPLDEIAAHYDKVRSTFSGQSAFITGLKRFATGNSHSSAAADAILKEAFGDQPLSSLPPLPKLVLVSCAVDMFPIQPYLLTSYALSPTAQRAAEFHRTCNTSCANAVRATTSAPGFYEPARVGGHRMVDGALVANNPSAVALAEAALLWPGAPIDVFVSLGTGMQKLRPWGWQDVAGPGVIVKWVQTVLDLCTNSYVVHRAVSTILGPVYHRFDPYGRLDDGFGIGDVDLDETDISVLSMMLREGRRYIERSDPLFKRVAAALLSNASPGVAPSGSSPPAGAATTTVAAAAASVMSLHTVAAPAPPAAVLEGEGEETVPAHPQ